MAEKLIDAFPQIERISNKDLKTKVIDCWMEALKQGGWEVEDLEEIPFTLLITDAPVSLGAHTRNVTDCSIALGEVMAKGYKGILDINFDLLIAGAILHDVAKVLEYRREGGAFKVTDHGRILRHPISGCALAAKMGLPESVQHIIAVHSREGDGGHRTAEAYIIHHADFVNYHPLKDR